VFSASDNAASVQPEAGQRAHASTARVAVPQSNTAISPSKAAFRLILSMSANLDLRERTPAATKVSIRMRQCRNVNKMF
jgi:hypothetical protein